MMRGYRIEQVRHRMVRIAFIGLVLAAAACQTTPRAPSVYQSWGEHLKTMVAAPAESGRGYTVADVSMLLGAPPVRTDTVSSKARAGVLVDQRKTDSVEIALVIPGSSAETAGLRRGDVVTAVDGVPTPTLAEWQHPRPERAAGTPIAFSTSRGEVTVESVEVVEEDCYWDINAGGVSAASSVGSSNASGGTAVGGSNAHQRFFRATCRFFDGVLVACKANWQE